MTRAIIFFGFLMIIVLSLFAGFIIWGNHRWIGPVSSVLGIITGTGTMAGWVYLGLRVSPRFRNITIRVFLPISFTFNRLLRLMLRPPVIIGRQDELYLVQQLLKSVTDSPATLYFSAFAGNGKSFLLNYLYEMRSVPNTYIAHINNGEQLGSVLGRVFVSLLYGTKCQSPRAVMQAVAERLPARSLILIDEFQYSDKSFLEDFSFFLHHLKSLKRPVVLVLAARREPDQYRDLFQFHKIPCMKPSEIRELINLRVQDKAYRQELINNMQRLIEVTSGNVKIVEFVCGNPNAWKIIKADESKRLTEFEYIKQLFEQLGQQLEKENPEHRQALRIIATLSRFEETIDDNLAHAIFGVANWSLVRARMQDHFMLEPYPEGKYKFHDLFAQSIYDNMPLEARKRCHNELHKIYECNSATTSIFVSFRHALEADNFTGAYNVYNNNKSDFLECLSLNQITKDLEKLYALAQTATPEEQASILADIGYCYSMIGDYEFAKKRLSKVLDDFASSLSPGKMKEIKVRQAFVFHCQSNFKEACDILALIIAKNNCPSYFKDEARCLDAHCRAHLGQLRKARQLFSAILDECKEHEDVIADALWGLSWVERALGNLGNSLELAEKCLILTLRKNQYRPIGLSYWNLATMQRINQNFPVASKYLECARKELDKMGIRSGTHVLHEDAEIIRANGDFARAQEIYEKALQLASEKIKDHDFRMHIRLGLAETKRCQGRFDRAEYDDCIFYFGEAGINWAHLSSRIGKWIGELSVLHEPFDQGVWNDLFKIASEIGMKSEQQALELIRSDPGRNYLHPLFFM